MFLLTVNAPSQAPATTELKNGRYQIGRHPQCEIPIPVSELADRSALLEVRGEVVFLRNLNSFPIYVGESELQPGQQSEWMIGQTLLLSQNVYLDLGKVEALQEGAADANRAKKTRSTIQIGVILGCILVAFFLLSDDSSNKQDISESRYNFTELVEPLEKNPKYEEVLKSLREARIADVRWGRDNPERAIKAYELLLGNELVIQAGRKGDTDGPVEKARAFAIDRIAYLTNLKKGN